MRNWFIVSLFFMVASIRPPTTHAEIRTFPVNIVALAPDPDRTLDFDRAKRFISILNAGYRDGEGKQVVSFTLKAFHRVDDLNIQECDRLVALGDQTIKPLKDEVYNAFDTCHDGRIANHQAINVYLFRSTFDNGEGKSSRIYFYNFEPFAFMNVDRLDNDWNVWVHEFGHVFGLPESPACGSTPETPTNPMGHVVNFCEGTGGNRKLGFEQWQVGIIKATSAIVAYKIRPKEAAR